jgi:hypothetical protein
MVKVWAEKEMRNLARLRQAGIRAPAPILLRMHVLVMEFIGEGGTAAPRLKVGGKVASDMLGFMVCWRHVSGGTKSMEGTTICINSKVIAAVYQFQSSTG